MADTPQNTQHDVDMDDFEAGFNDGLDENNGETEVTLGEENDEGLEAQAHTAPPVTPAQPEPALPEQPAHTAPPEQLAMPPHAEDVPPSGLKSSASAVGIVEIDANIADDFAELERLSPQAAALAREDSPDGEVLRKRLAAYGAEGTMDRVEMILERRQRTMDEAQAEQQVITEHNRSFLATIAADHPEMFAPDRTKEENARFAGDMKRWIESLPYAEGSQLMAVFENGRDPRQVSAMISRFKKEGHGENQTGKALVRETSRADPTAAMAVAGRGAPMVPKSAGGKDDFEAGWNL